MGRRLKLAAVPKNLGRSDAARRGKPDQRLVDSFRGFEESCCLVVVKPSQDLFA
jgi:hypothetical protein